MSRILVPYDGSELSADALTFALENATDDTTIVVLSVVEPFPDHTDAALSDGEDSWMERAEGLAETMLEEARTIVDEADADGVDFETRWRYGRPRREIVETVEDDAFDQIVMGSHGRDGIERLIVGSVAEHVMRRAEVPVTVVR